jgi:thermostable 8-oxoguanine DNA glycosylase
MDRTAGRNRLVAVVRALAVEKRAELDRHKDGYSGLARPDFIWHYLLQSFSTMGRESGWHGLIGNQNNYRRITFDTLTPLSAEDRNAQIRQVCRAAGIRMPDKKADYIIGCFEYVTRLGGLAAVKAKLFAQQGREAKIAFLQSFPGIGPKYARNIMMDVYHEDFRDSIALDVRIKGISEALGLSFASYAEHEAFFLSVAREAGLNGWELDRLLFNFRSEVESRLGVSGTTAARSKRCN